MLEGSLVTPKVRIIGQVLTDDCDDEIFRFGRLLVGKLRLIGVEILMKFQVQIGVQRKAILSFLPVFGVDGREP